MEKRSNREYLKGTRRSLLATGARILLYSLGSLAFNAFSCGKKEKKLLSMDIMKGGNSGDGPSFESSYVALHAKGTLKKRGEELWELMRNCSLCPRKCGVNRIRGSEGFCRSSSLLKVSAFNPHFGEERGLVGTGGSGTVFLTSCGLRCVYCINWEINHAGMGYEASIEDLAGMMIKLQNTGCHNINLVTPTHFSPHIVLAIDAAARMGLKIPMVYNTSGYEETGIIKKLEGIVDIYLPDFKYSSGEMASIYSAGAGDYPEKAKTSILEMQRQVGTARPGAGRLIRKGLMIRHLVLPNDVSGSREVMQWISRSLPKETYVNIMSQYRPSYRASEYPKIARRVTREEYARVIDYAKKTGLTNLDIQGDPL